MADTPPATSSGASSPPSSAAEQARIRKERREAKIRAGGSARLNKITGLGGGIQRDPPPQPAVTSHADPDEVDISQHYYQPQATPRPATNSSPSPAPQQALDNDALRQMMLGFDTPPAGTPPPADDPMLKMLQQMMGGVPGEGPGGMPAFPGMGAGMPGLAGQEVTAAEDPHAYLWRIAHAVFALSLGLYIALTTTFAGTKLERDRSGLSYRIAGQEAAGLSPASIHFFWIFATAEVLLQTSRLWLEKGRPPQGGILGMVMGFLPEPFKGYLALAARYSRIWTTVSGDAMVCVFVLGVCAWLRGS